MGYIREMRALVGTRPLILVGAGVLVENARGEVLLERRADTGLWGVPGGCMEIGETTEEAARREVREETGLEVGEMTLLGVFSGLDLLHVYPNGDEAAIVSVAYLSRDYRGELRSDPAESLEARFFAPAELAEMDVNAPDRPIIAAYLATLSWD
ncbi:MAG TPA: NUDIX hydrolase [Armatimonadaceae bacterium]|nr:NUDIX hydrolase [Armatimonadaceae bacterium]